MRLVQLRQAGHVAQLLRPVLLVAAAAAVRRLVAAVAPSLQFDHHVQPRRGLSASLAGSRVVPHQGLRKGRECSNH